MADQKVDWNSIGGRGGRSDADGDAAELEELQAKLTKQMGFNNQLTKHVNDLELRSANHSTELREKEATLRRALEAMDIARTEKNELRSRLQSLEQSNALMSNEVRAERHDGIYVCSLRAYHTTTALPNEFCPIPSRE